MLTRAGVKLLDFGLARSFSAAPDSAAALTAMPTVPPNLTQEGSILGTVQYMAPEQLEGKSSDARTDIFALGALLYEMATGRKAFSGSSQASLISSIMKEEPAPITSLSPMSPAALDRVVRTCLAKDPDDRWQTARDVGLQLQGIRDDRSASQTGVIPLPGRRLWPRWLPWLIAAAGLAVAAYAVTRAPRRTASSLPVLRTYLPPPPNANFHTLGANVGGVALSPDGRRLVFGAHEADGMHRLWVRDLDALEPYPVPGAEEAIMPFWSPDSRSVGFFARGKLKTVEASPRPAGPARAGRRDRAARSELERRRHDRLRASELQGPDARTRHGWTGGAGDRTRQVARARRRTVGRSFFREASASSTWRGRPTRSRRSKSGTRFSWPRSTARRRAR